ncbi:hypothetical protein IW261DRAFT_1484148 [Armillaria novae-zelandiae]|uniref:Secreted protein n=1 Tax=Armillaria novae-zelandiae TaxID=153914 RepID=A0AA39P5E7_9AGAR|nr:hypothetical protein IW261DRAFT_1484148 [Armillaria novae-zelandiae]
MIRVSPVALAGFSRLVHVFCSLQTLLKSGSSEYTDVQHGAWATWSCMFPCYEGLQGIVSQSSSQAVPVIALYPVFRTLKQWPFLSGLWRPVKEE